MRRIILIFLALVAISAVAGSSSSDPSRSAESVSPIRNPNGIRPGLKPIAPADLPRARAIIGRVRVGSPEVGGYDRSAFGTPWTDSSGATWSGNHCGTRDDVLKRDLSGETFRSGTHDCIVLSGVLDDPYTGEQIEFSKSRAQAIQIDHVIALSYAWRQGAGNWSEAKRERLANDPLNLLAVDGPENIRKSDRGPSQWMPRESERCAFSVRVVQVAIRFKLPVQSDDKNVMKEACS